MVVEFVYTVERVRRFTFAKCPVPSSETQRQIVRARESLNGRENMARRKVKNGQKSPWGQCLTRPVPNGARKLLCFSAQSEARMAATVWNWSGKTLSPGALLVVLYFSSCHIFPRVETFPCLHYLPLDLRGWSSSSCDKYLRHC